jgi:predicted dehydrogenase
MSGPMRVGVIGVGAISASYLGNLTQFPDVEVIRLGDLDEERAAARAAEFGVPSWGSADDVLADPDIELVVNLTIPAVHAEISERALEAGKHVWSEKPIGITREQARRLVRLAADRGLRLGVAPDTLLGPGMQTVRRIIERGDIGQPLSASAMMQNAGPQRGHPNPEFLFQRGAGPLYDFGPYYLTALVDVLGPFARVAAQGSRPADHRVIGSGPRAGTVFPVEVPTTVALLAEFERGGTAQATLSWDAQLQRMGFFEVYGTEGTLAITDPNMFTGRIRVARAPEPGPFNPDYEIEWSELPVEGVLTGRGLGVVDMVRAIAEGRPHVADDTLAAHVLDVMASIDESIETHAYVEVESTVAPVPLLPDGFDPFASSLAGVRA